MKITGTMVKFQRKFEKFKKIFENIRSDTIEEILPKLFRNFE